ncbi:MAG: peptidoglycan editing factor PgeF [Sphingomicrobium sp.]
MSGVDVMRATALGDIPHGFLSRSGGVSGGILAGLNVGWGSGDEREAIAENRRRAVEAVMPGARLVTVHQVHSADVIEAGDWSDDNRPHADALVTDRPGILLGILTADCAPVLLADREAGVIGAAHAGWRGAVAGVAANTVAAMEKLGARRERIAAAVGPCIARANYEVDHPFADRLIAVSPNNDLFFTDGPAGKPHFDLESFVVASLATAGVTRIEALGPDTYANPDRFYSYRRATHRGEPDYGRQISLIGLIQSDAARS